MAAEYFLLVYYGLLGCFFVSLFYALFVIRRLLLKRNAQITAKGTRAPPPKTGTEDQQ